MKKYIVMLMFTLSFEGVFAQSLIPMYQSANLIQPSEVVNDNIYLAMGNTSEIATTAELFSTQAENALFAYSTGRGVLPKRLIEKPNGAGWVIGIDEINTAMMYQVKIFDLDENFNQVKSYTITSSTEEVEHVMLGDIFYHEGDILVWGTTNEDVHEGPSCGGSLFLKRINGIGHVYTNIVNTTVQPFNPSSERAETALIHGNLFLGAYSVREINPKEGRLAVFDIGNGVLLDTVSLDLTMVNGLVASWDGSFYAYGYVVTSGKKQFAMTRFAVSDDGMITLLGRVIFAQEFEPAKAVLDGRSLIVVGSSPRGEEYSLFPQARILVISGDEIVYDERIPIPEGADGHFQSACVDISVGEKTQVLVHFAGNMAWAGQHDSKAHMYEFVGVTSSVDTEEAPIASLFVYPNPSDGRMTIESQSDNLVADIVNSVGSLVHRMTLRKGKNFYHLPLSSGVYTITTAEGSKKIVIQ